MDVATKDQATVRSPQCQMERWLVALRMGPLGENCYVISGSPVIVIDPGWVDSRVEEAIAKFQPEPGASISIILTHGHADHFVGAAALLSQYAGSVVRITVEDRPFLYDWRLNMSQLFEMKLRLPAEARVELIKDGDVITNGTAALRVVATPGHTPGSVVLVEESKKTIFTGDTLFSGGGVGRTDFPGGDEAALRVSLKRVMAYPADFAVLPGHGCAAKIGGAKPMLF